MDPDPKFFQIWIRIQPYNKYGSGSDLINKYGSGSATLASKSPCISRCIATAQFHEYILHVEPDLKNVAFVYMAKLLTNNKQTHTQIGKNKTVRQTNMQTERSTN